MFLTHTSKVLLILLLPIIYSVSTSAQGLTQNQTCANACTAAQACDHQCVPGTSHDPYANIDIYVDCVCQSGCLCNAEICLQCCEADGNNSDPQFQSCPFIQLAAGNVLAYCSVEGSTPAKATPAKACFVYGDGENGSPISTYASNSPFPSSVATFISGLLPLTNVTIAASSLITAKADTTSSSFPPTTGVTGSTSVSSPTTPKADTGTTMTTSLSQSIGKAASVSPSPLITSAPTSITPQSSITAQPITSSQKSAAEGTRPMAAKGFIILPLALPFILLFL